MEIFSLFKELKERECYNEFMTKYPEAFFCAGFFIISEEGDKANLDFFIPKERKMASFEYPFSNFKIHEDEIKEAKPLDNLEGLKIDVGGLKGFVETETGKKFPKIIAVLQNGIWNLTCLNGLDMSRIKIDAYSGEFKKKDEGNLMDMIRIKKK